MSQKLSQYFFWKGLKSDVYKKCSSCVTCASVRGQGNHGRPPLVSIPVGGPIDCVGMDFVELDVTQDGNRYALVFQDYLTKWPEWPESYKGPFVIRSLSTANADIHIS